MPLSAVYKAIKMAVEGFTASLALELVPFLSLITSGAVDTDDIITAACPLAEAGKAFGALLDPERIEVLLTMVTA